MAFTLTGFDGKVAVVTGAGRMRSIGRPIALALAYAGCDVVLTGTGRAPETCPQDEQQAGWRDIESVADEIRALGRRALPVITSVADPEAGELGPKKIRVNVVAPGIIDTSRLDDVPRGQVWDDMISTFIPLGRAGTGEDVANMVTFLCSEQGAWVTGQHIYVDGGHGATPRRPAAN